MNGLFKRVGAVSPGRSVFDLSYEKKSSLRIWDIFIPLCVMRSCQATSSRLKRGGYKVPASRFPYDARSELLRALFLCSLSSA